MGENRGEQRRMGEKGRERRTTKECRRTKENGGEHRRTKENTGEHRRTGGERSRTEEPSPGSSSTASTPTLPSDAVTSGGA